LVENDQNERPEYVTVLGVVRRDRVCSIKIITNIEEICAKIDAKVRDSVRTIMIFCTKIEETLTKN
jgi:hypothetical protein